MTRKASRPAAPAPQAAAPSVVFVADVAPWPDELVSLVAREGYIAVRIEDLALAPSLLRRGDVRAVFVGARPLGGKDLLVLRECREIAPATSIVVMATAATDPDLKRAFESGATAFLSWPAPPEAVRQVLRSGEPAGPTPDEPRTNGWKQ